MDKTQVIVYRFIQKIAEYLIEKENRNPVDVKYDLRGIVTKAIDDYLMHTNWKVQFDSPMGYISADILNKLGLTVEWDGEQGHRGTTTVYLPKDNISKEDAGNIDKIIEMLSKISKNEELENIFDEYSTITVMNTED